MHHQVRLQKQKVFVSSQFKKTNKMKANKQAVQKLLTNEGGALSPPAVVNKEEDSDICESESDLIEKIEDELYTIHANKKAAISIFSAQANILVQQAFESNNPKVQKMYKKYQTMWFKFMETNKCEDFMDQKAMIAFFHELNDQYKPSTLWVIYSCLNSWYLMEYNFDLKDFKSLRKMLKQKTEHHVATKAACFSPEDIHEGVLHFGKSANPRDNLMAIAILLCYYGLLRMNDLLKIEKKDVTYDEKMDCYVVEFNYIRKRQNLGLTYFIPPEYNSVMHRYHQSVADYDPSKHGKVPPRYLCNFNVKAQKRIQNAGHSNISKFATDLATWLKKPHPEQYTMHSWRRSGATNLADAGCNLTDLKRFGQW